MKIKEIINLIEGELLSGNFDDELTEIKQDSREIRRGDTFITFKGEESDGNDYIYKAIENGAKTCIVNTKDLKPMDVNIIYVEDSQKAIEQIAEYVFEESNPIRIAITGSVGKTSTRDITTKILSEKFKTFKNEKNYNDKRSIPLTFSKMEKGTEVAVIEMGMFHAGEIEYLSKRYRPDYAIITTVGTPNIGFLGSIENILKAKLEIKEGIKDGGKLIINIDNKWLKGFYDKQGMDLFTPYDIVTFGIDNKDATIVGEVVEMTNDEMKFKVKTKKASFTCVTNLVGKHNLYNMLPGIYLALELGLTKKEIQNAVKDIRLTERRMDKFINENNILVFDDTYNACLESVKVGIDILANQKERRKVLIIGDLLELAEFNEKIHKEIAEYAELKKLDLVISGGEATRIVQDNIQNIEKYHFSNADEIIENLGLLKPNDAVLIKASNGMNFNKIANALR